MSSVIVPTCASSWLMPRLRGMETRAKDTHCFVQESEKGKAESQIIPSASRCLEVEFAQRLTKWAWNSVKKCRHRCQLLCMWSRHCNFFMVLRSYTPMDGQPTSGNEVLHQKDFDLSVENPAMQTCHASTSEN